MMPIYLVSVMLMYNWIEYSSISSEVTGSSWFYYINKATYFNADIANADNFNIVSKKLKY